MSEVCFWRRGRITVHRLKGEASEPATTSEALPDLDLDLLARILDWPTTYDAIRDYRAALTARRDDQAHP